MRRFRFLLSLGVVAATSWTATCTASQLQASPALLTADSTEDPSRPVFGGSIGTASGGATVADPTRPVFGGSIGTSSGHP